MTGARVRVLLCAAALLAGVQPVLSAANDVPLAAPDTDLTLVCAEDGTSAPQFRHDRTGTLSPIRDPRLHAIADRVCNPLLEDAPARVDLTNSRDTAIFIGFTLATQAPGPITWGTGCTPTGGGAQLAPGTTCQVTVPTTAGSSRFCAALDQPPADCYEAQANHQTMVETTFQAASNPGCFNKGSCIWYDISVIPQDCTDALWRQDRCATTGGASYNLPVALACGGAATFTCQGPTDATYGPANYPSQCGNPEAMCVGNTDACVQAYFFPMFTPPESKYGPNVPCLGGQTLGVTFLSGP